MPNENFITWLCNIVGEKPTSLADHTHVSKSLITLYTKRERFPTVKFLKTVSEVYGISYELLKEQAGRYRAGDIGPDQSTTSVEAELPLLKNPKYALGYCLGGRMPPETIEKLVKIIDIELSYCEAKKYPNPEWMKGE